MKQFFKEVGQALIPMIIAVILVLIVKEFFFYPVRISGDSMYPFLQNGERAIVQRNTKIKRDDIVVFPGPDSPKDEYIKRIIGLPGDEVTYKNNQLYINGQKIDESKRAITESDDFTLQNLTGQKVVPDGYYFVLGDNRPVSKDSRYFGFISDEDIDGVAKFRFWPFSKWGSLTNK